MGHSLKNVGPSKKTFRPHLVSQTGYGTAQHTVYSDCSVECTVHAAASHVHSTHVSHQVKMDGIPEARRTTTYRLSFAPAEAKQKLTAKTIYSLNFC